MSAVTSTISQLIVSGSISQRLILSSLTLAGYTNVPPNGNPSSLVATTESPTSISLTWTRGSTDEDGFSIERSSTSDFTEIATVTAGVTTYSDTSCLSGTIYYYKVRGFKTSEYSEDSNTSYAETYWLPTNYNTLFAWYDANQITGLSDGADVTQWNDVSGNARHLTGVGYPTYNLNRLNSLPAVTTDGTNDYLIRTVSLSQPFTLIAVLKRNAGTDLRYFIDGQLSMFYSDVRITVNAGTSVNIDVSSLLNRTFIHSLVLNGASSLLGHDGTYSDANPGTDGFTRFALAEYSPSHQFRVNADYYDVILIAEALNINNIRRLENYLAWKYDLTLADLPYEDVFIHSEPSIIYVSSAGANDGSTALLPADLQTALSSDRIIPGDTIMLMDGTYVGQYSVLVNGTSGNNITICAQNYYMAKIDGGINIGDNTGDTGCYITVRGLEIYDSNTDRGTGVEPAFTFIRPNSLNIYANNVSIIDNILHDGGLGITAYGPADDFICYGNLIYNYGAYEVGGAGQCIYIHSTNKTVKHNIIGGSFRKSVAIYTTNDTIEDITLEENVIFSSGTVLAGGDASDGQVISESIIANHILNNGIQLGYTMTPNLAAICNNNRVYGDNPLTASYFQNLTINGNKFTGQETSGNGCFEINYTTEKVSYLINNNEYHNIGAGTPVFHEGTYSGAFAGWQALGHDADGSYSTELPTTNETFVYANEYPVADDPRMGIVVIWNWAGDNTVTVDLTDLGLEIGTTYRWRQAQDPLVDVDTWECAGNSYTFTMTGHTVAKPTGVDIELVETQFPTFGCFIIEKV